MSGQSGVYHGVGSQLDLACLRGANRARIPQFRNRKGKLSHSERDGSDWCLAQWCNAMTGEVGEAANLIKKIERGDFSLDEARHELGKELADILIYLDILADQAGISLAQATVDKFNEVSLRVKANVFLRGLAYEIEGDRG